MTADELKVRISDSLKDTLPLICQECQGHGMVSGKEGDEECGNCKGTGLDGFMNAYAEKLVLALAREFAAGELQSVFDSIESLASMSMSDTWWIEAPKEREIIRKAIASLTDPK